MGREKVVDALELVEGLMVVGYGGVLVKGVILSLGKLRFLKGWLFSRGQQLMVRFLPWITLCFMVVLWWIVVVRVIVMRNLLLPVTFLSDSSFFVEYMLRLFGIEWVMLGSVVDLLFCWYHWLGKHSSNIWNLVLGYLMWTIWTKQNRWSFENEGKTVVQLLNLCQRIFFDWSWCWGFLDCSTLMDFLSSIRIA